MQPEPEPNPNPRVFFEVTFDRINSRRIEMELFRNVAPITVANFLTLCDVNTRDPSGRALNYIGSLFHRVIRGSICQGGDVYGVGNSSINGQFPPENSAMSHRYGTLSMIVTRDDVTRNPPTYCGSHFFICTGTENEQFDGQHVAFGQVLEGSFDVLRLIDDTGDAHGRVNRPAQILNCGVYQ